MRVLEWLRLRLVEGVVMGRRVERFRGVMGDLGLLWVKGQHGMWTGQLVGSMCQPGRLK